MNRLQYLVDDAHWARSCVSHAPELAVAASAEHDSPYCLFTPEHYERNYAYPLVVWLHGPDDDERQVTRVMPLISVRNYVGVGPRGTSPAGVPGGFRWVQEAEQIGRAEERVELAVAAARRRLNIEPARIFLAGYACGGTMAMRIALAQPRRFAGALSIGGPLPMNLRPLAQWHEARRLNLFLATGRESSDYPESEVCQHLRLLHAAGIALNLRLYPCGDDVTTDMLADMDRWIMEQVAGGEPAVADQPSHPSRRD